MLPYGAMAILIRDIVLLAVLIGGMALAAGLAAGVLAGRYGWPPKRIDNWSGYGYGLLFLGPLLAVRIAKGVAAREA